jgi:hypothetical protein
MPVRGIREGGLIAIGEMGVAVGSYFQSRYSFVNKGNTGSQL